MIIYFIDDISQNLQLFTIITWLCTKKQSPACLISDLKPKLVSKSSWETDKLARKAAKMVGKRSILKRKGPFAKEVRFGGKQTISSRNCLPLKNMAEKATIVSVSILPTILRKIYIESWINSMSVPLQNSNFRDDFNLQLHHRNRHINHKESSNVGNSNKTKSKINACPPLLLECHVRNYTFSQINHIKANLKEFSFFRFLGLVHGNALYECLMITSSTYVLR